MSDLVKGVNRSRSYKNATFIEISLAGSQSIGGNPAFNGAGITFNTSFGRIIRGNDGVFRTHPETDIAAGALGKIYLCLFFDDPYCFNRAVSHTKAASGAKFNVDLHYNSPDNQFSVLPMVPYTSIILFHFLYAYGDKLSASRFSEISPMLKIFHVSTTRACSRSRFIIQRRLSEFYCIVSRRYSKFVY